VPPASTAELKDLYEQHSRMILRTAWRITGKPEDAEEVLQQIFLRLLRGHPPDAAGPVTGGYLRRAAVNGGLDIVRARQARPDQVSSEGSPGIPEPATLDNPEETMRNLDLADALCRAVSSLNSRAAEVFMLRDIEGLEIEEIAGLLGTSPNTVTVTCHRARTRILEILTSWNFLPEKTGCKA